jgi:outer membrane protein OmpA-like peptidoglycan-associated protein
MRMRRLLLICGVGGMVLTVSMTAGADAQQADSIGNVAAVQRQVEVLHPGGTTVSVVQLGAAVLFKDTYETKSQAKLKLLFRDDSVLSLGENTRLQIAENIYHPDQGQRSTVINLMNGSVRALVGKFFGGPGSKFEIHTPTAAAAARGTYFIVWTVRQQKVTRKPQLIMSLSDILFDTGKDTLHSGSEDMLAKVAKILSGYPDHKIEVRGYTDNVGADPYNLKLSKQRAETVRTALIADGIPPDMITAEGLGRLNPVASNATAEGRQLNRRVEMVVLNPPSSPEEETTVEAELLLPTEQAATATQVGQNLTGVLNIGETGKVTVSNIDPAVTGSVVLDQGQYTMVAEAAPPTPAAKLSQDKFEMLLSTTEVQSRPVQVLPEGPEAPGADATEIATPLPSRPATQRQPGVEVPFPTVPPILQQPSPSP